MILAIVSVGLITILLSALSYYLKRQKPQSKFQINADIRNQQALDHYLNRSHSPVEIGRQYERYIGYLLECDGYDVEFHGAVKGVADMGRDLIAKKGNEVRIIQAKYLAKRKLIPVNQIFQLFGSVTHFARSEAKLGQSSKAVFYSKSPYSPQAVEAAMVLGMELKTMELDRSYPMIKCNITAKGEKIYHLPIDEYYDKVKIDTRIGEFYAHTVRQASAKGFRRARKYIGNKKAV